MSDKQKEQWENAFWEYHNTQPTLEWRDGDLVKYWLEACEYMHKNMSQSRYNFYKKTKLQQKKIDELQGKLDEINFYIPKIGEKASSTRDQLVIANKKIDVLYSAFRNMKSLGSFVCDTEERQLQKVRELKDYEEKILEKLKELDKDMDK